MKSLVTCLLLSIVLSACMKDEPQEPVVLEFPDRPNAQQPANGDFEWPGSWEYRLDGSPDGLVISGDSLTINPDVYFTNMTPGWHVTMKSAAGIFWHPASTAEGDFTASAHFYLFNPGVLNEGYGIFVGGSDLSGEDQHYIYFLLRRSGEFLVKQRTGSTTTSLVPWTHNDAIVAWTDESEVNIANSLEIATEGNHVSFRVNGTEVHSMPRGELSYDGVVGFRLNHATNVHISSFDVTTGPATTTAETM